MLSDAVLTDAMVRQMVDALPLPIAVEDHNGIYRYVNRAFEQLFHVRSDTIVGRRANLTLASDRLVERSTFRSADGDQLVMTVVHAEQFTPELTDDRPGLADELRQTRAELARLRETDPVTQALSRRALRAHTEDELAVAAAGALRISVDDYESVSETFGVDVGDELLAQFGDIVRANTRPGDVFARVAPSEFTLLLRGADRDQTAAVARRICEAATAARTGDGTPKLALSVTVGAAHTDGDDIRLAELIDEAEHALRTAPRACNEAVVA